MCQHVLTCTQSPNITINKSMNFTFNLQPAANKIVEPKKEHNYLNKPSIVPTTTFSNKPKYNLATRYSSRKKKKPTPNQNISMTHKLRNTGVNH